MANLLAAGCLTCLYLFCLPGSAFCQDKGVFLIQQDEKCGFIDKTGRIIIRPTFEEAGRFHDGLARVKVGSEWGYINKSGKIVINQHFEAADDFSEGLAAVQIESKHGYIDPSGRIVIKTEYDEAWPFSEGLALVNKSGKYGYINKTGDVVIPFRFEGAGDFVEGLGLVVVAGKYGYIDRTGKVVVEPQFELSGGFSEGRARVLVNGKVGYIDVKGRMVVAPQYDSAAPFSGGFAVVRVDTKLGYINRNGEIVIKPQFVRAGNFSEGLAPVSLGSHGGFVDTHGKLVIENVWFDMGQEFFDGLALVETSYGLAYIDRRGSYIWKEKIRPLPEILKEIRQRTLNAKQKRHAALFKEYESDESLADQVAKSKRGQNISYGKVGLAPGNAALPGLATFLRDLACNADAVVEGQFMNELPLFTPNGKFIFTEYKLNVVEILKDNKNLPILKRQPITVIRSGGRISIAGRTVEAYVGASFFPKPAERYLLFLRYLPVTTSYRAWVNGIFHVRVDSVDKLSPNTLWKAGDTTDPAKFLEMARKSIGGACTERTETRLAEQ